MPSSEFTVFRAVMLYHHLLAREKTHKLIKTDAKCQQAMKSLGNSFNTDEVYNLCEAYTCQLYGQEDGSDINRLRYELFIAKSGASSSLLPSKEPLVEHVKRANYVARIWELATEASIDAPPPINHGWTLENDEADYSIKWHSGVLAQTMCYKPLYANARKPAV